MADLDEVVCPQCKVGFAPDTMVCPICQVSLVSEDEFRETPAPVLYSLKIYPLSKNCGRLT
jgi:rubredoxin